MKHNIIRHKKRTIPNLGLLLLIAIGFTIITYSQTSNTNLDKQVETNTIVKTDAEKDSKHLGLKENNNQNSIKRNKKNDLVFKMLMALKNLNWTDYTKFSIDFVNTYVLNDYLAFNYYALTFYENDAITDKKALNQAIKWVKISIENDKEHELTYMETHALLLYKLGNKKEALKKAKKLVEATKKAGSDTKGALNLIKKIKANYSIYSQKKNTISEIPYENKAVLKTDAEKDWEYIKFMSGYSGTSRLGKVTMLEVWEKEDKIALNRSRLAKAFMNKYPNDPNYIAALHLFVNDYFQPYFISEIKSEEQTQFFSKFPSNVVVKDWRRVRRAVPLDKEAKERWLKYGNDLLAKVLASNASLERKASVSMAFITRDFFLATNYYSFLSKKPEESDYWESFDTHYWAFLQQDLNSLMDTYPDSELIVRFIPNMLNILKYSSPKLARTYLKAFYIKTSNNNPLADRASIKALHNILKENLKNIKAIEALDGTEPIEMEFTAMDGTKVNLADMKGKVVMIDFWSTSCAPCIKEMPYIRALYDKYRDEGFEVIGIAGNGDGGKESILEIQKKTGANWPQRLDKGKDATVSYISLYNITSFPTVWLLNMEGVIVDKNARGERLELLIRKHLGLDN